MTTQPPDCTGLALELWLQGYTCCQVPTGCVTATDPDRVLVRGASLALGQAAVVFFPLPNLKNICVACTFSIRTHQFSDLTLAGAQPMTSS